MKKNLVLLLFAFIFTACADDKKETDNAENQLYFSSETIEKKLNNCNPEEGKCTFISLVFPIAENGGKKSENINREIEKFLMDAIDYQDGGIIEKPEELAAAFIKNYQETAEEFPEYELPWEATVVGKIAYQNAELISIKFNTDIFTGGAHGYRSTRYLNFDPKTGKKFTTQEIFKSGFRKYVEKDFREKQDIPIDQNINSTGLFFENDEFQLPQNIGISEKNIILHYNAYEIAPYADGNFILTYPKSEIVNFLKLEGSKPKA